MLATVERWQIEHEPTTTAECYWSLPVGSGCDCVDCVSFLAAIDRVYPLEFNELLGKLGIDPRKPAELCHYGTDEAGLRRTHGWYHFVGTLREGRDCWSPTGEDNWTADLELWRPGLEIGLTCRLALVRPPFDRHPLVQLEFAGCH